MMNNVYLCVGAKAKNPYYFEKVYANVYTIEELCYVLYENAFLIDRDILNRNLVLWIETECKLPDLARNLYSLINQNAQPGAFVGTILEYAGYYTKDEIDKVESILRMNVSMNVFEKWKAKADFLFENRHFLLAVREYEHLLETLDEDEMDLRSRVYKNMGVTYMNLNLYESAIECFKHAFEINNDETAYKYYLTAKRLELSEDDYIRFIADEEDAYRMSVPLEGELEAAKAEFEDSPEAKHMQEIFALKDRKEADLYFEEVTRMTESLKAEYRDMTIEAEQM